MDGLGAAQAMQWLGSVYGEASLWLCLAIFAGVTGGILLGKVNAYKDERYSKK